MKNRQAYEEIYDKSHDVVKIEKYFDGDIVYNLKKTYCHSEAGRPSTALLVKHIRRSVSQIMEVLLK